MDKVKQEFIRWSQLNKEYFKPLTTVFQSSNITYKLHLAYEDFTQTSPTSFDAINLKIFNNFHLSHDSITPNDINFASMQEHLLTFIEKERDLDFFIKRVTQSIDEKDTLYLLYPHATSLRTRVAIIQTDTTILSVLDAVLSHDCEVYIFDTNFQWCIQYLCLEQKLSFGKK